MGNNVRRACTPMGTRALYELRSVLLASTLPAPRWCTVRGTGCLPGSGRAGQGGRQGGKKRTRSLSGCRSSKGLGAKQTKMAENSVTLKLTDHPDPRSSPSACRAEK